MDILHRNLVHGVVYWNITNQLPHVLIQLVNELQSPWIILQSMTSNLTQSLMDTLLLYHKAMIIIVLILTVSQLCLPM